MKVDQLFYITLNLAAESRSLVVLSASLSSLLRQFDHPTELDEELDLASQEIFHEIIQHMEQITLHGGIQVSLNYNEGYLEITFAYRGEAIAERRRPENWGKCGKRLSAVISSVDQVKYQRKGDVNMLVLTKQLTLCPAA